MIIFDCNGVLVDGEIIAAETAAEEFTRAGFTMTPQLYAHFFTGRRTPDILTAVEEVSRRKLPPHFASTLAEATMRRFRNELRISRNAAHALTWLRGRKCVASSSPLDRIRATLEMTGLLRFFDPYLFSAHDVSRGKPAPDLFLHVAAKMKAAPAECIVVEDSPVGVQAAVAAGMAAIGYTGGSQAHPQLASQLRTAGARTVIDNMRALKEAIIALRGW